MKAPVELTERFDQAMLLASELHRAQRRKNNDVPFVAHLLGVTSIVLEHGGDEDEAIAALLHDAVEDQGGEATLALIRERFGNHVAEIVAALSDSFADTNVSAKPPWRPRKETYLSHLATANPSVLLISCADKLYNTRSLLRELVQHGDDVWTMFRGGREGTLWYYRSLVQIFRQRPEAPQSLVDLLAETMDEIARLAQAEAKSESASSSQVG
jgi:(p)ppGpp synthase/HD superfamily hydrolase